MRSRLEHLVSTPRVIAALVSKGGRACARCSAHRLFLPAVLILLSMLLAVLVSALWQAWIPKRAAAYYRHGDYRQSAELFDTQDDAASRYNAANAWYRAGEYELALQRYSALASADRVFAAEVWYNRANTLVRLKAYGEARRAFARSLALHYDPEALENLMLILYAEEPPPMPGHPPGKKRAQESPAKGDEEGARKQKEGGGSNQPSAAQQRQGAGSQGKKAEREAQLEFSDKGANRLSSKQYELINQRSVHETKPW